MSDLEEKALEEFPIEIEGRLVDASNATLFGSIRISTGKFFPVVYKPVAGERPLWDFPHGTLASREVAAYQVSEILGFGCVPPTVLRDGPYGWGAVQRWIEIDEDVDVIALGQSHNPAIREMALFDAIINNTDRKFGHILPATDGEIYGCDHGVTFHVDDKLRTVLWQFSGESLTEEERSALQNLRASLHSISRLHNLLIGEEIQALESRIDRLLLSNIFPYPSEEWPAIPWPPV